MLSEKFGVSKSVARDMVSAMYSVYRLYRRKCKLVAISNEEYNAICEMSSKEG